MIKNTDNSPTELAIAALNGFKWLGNNLHNIKADPELFAKFYTSALEDAEKALAALDAPPKPAWTMPVAPAGPGWHRNDFTESDLPPVTDGGLPWRPLLVGELPVNGDTFLGYAGWVTQTDRCGKTVGGLKHRTRRPIPSVPKLRAWNKPEDVPGPVCWLRRGKDDRFPIIVIGFWSNGIVQYFDGSWRSVSWLALSREWQHSTDRKTWQPCGVTE